MGGALQLELRNWRVDHREALLCAQNAFDLLYLKGEDLRERSLSDRKYRLERLVLKVVAVLRKLHRP